MNATAVVAIIGAVTTPVVAFGGYIFGERRSRGDREAARLLARDTHEHERKMSADANRHASNLRTIDRIYEERTAAYLAALRFVMDVADANDQAVAKIQEGDDSPGPLPFASADDEAWKRIRIDIAAYATQRVDEAMATFSDAAQANDTAIYLWRRALAKDSGVDDAFETARTFRREFLDAVMEVRAGINAGIASPEEAEESPAPDS